MKKNFKRIFALLLSVIMVMAMATTVFADGTEDVQNEGGQKYTLTINSHTSYDTAVTYNIYQLFLCDLDKNNVPSYTATRAANASLVTGKTVEEFASLKEDADALYTFARGVTTENVTPYKTLTTGKAEEVEAGYYLLIPTNVASTTDSDSDTLNDKGGTVSAPILVAVPKVEKDQETNTYTVTPSVTVDSKDSVVTHQKKITDVISVNGNQDTFSTSGDTATSGQGDTIEYTITNTVPLYKKDVETTKVNYYVVDTYDNNLTLLSENPITVETPAGLNAGDGLDSTTVEAANGTEHTVYRVKNGDYYISKDDQNHKFTVYFNYDKVASATNVIIKAKFTLDETAEPGKEVVNNSELNYTNNYYTGTDSTLQDKVKSYTFKFNVFKYDDATKKPLAGATFGLYKDNACANEITTATSGEDGVVDFNIKLNDGVYYVKETSAPNGYRVDETVHTVVITATKDSTSNEYTGECTVQVDSNAVGTTVSVGNEVIYGASTGTEGEDGFVAANTVPVFGVANTAGTTLPGTGGIGTTIFTFGGLALVILAAVMFVVYMRKQKKQA